MISVIVPTYRRKCIIDCLEALRSQINLVVDFEVIVVSRDMPEFLQEYFENIAPAHWLLVGFTEPGNGPAKNFAVQQAKGSFIVFTDDDCIPDKNWLNRLYTAQQITTADIVVGACLPYDTNNLYLVAHQAHIQYYLETLASGGRYYPKTVCGTTMNMLIRKVTFKMLGGFNPLFANHFGDDRDFNVRWAADADIRAVYAYSAMVHHNHPFTFKSFIRTSFKYGVGIKNCAWIARVKGYKDIPAPPKRSEYGKLIKFLIGEARLGMCKTLYAALMLVFSQEVKRVGMWYARYNPEYTTK